MADASPLSFTILWSPLPPITWVLPFIGHMGIATSRGVACDFQGPYTVGERGRMVSLLEISNDLCKSIQLVSILPSHTIFKAFGKPTRALRIDIRSLPGGADQWDKAITEANAEYCTRMHNICCDNCHSHVAYALNAMDIRAYGVRNWDMVKLCFLMFFKGKFLGVEGFVRQFLPFGLLLLIATLVKVI
ncbi:hypothetical protein HJC23_005850 [Cyclotella cryptica]|uniref:Transmembrane protein 222 n=1 Tax=Cyclotella cryptica TaxID=29204 RepID=A0ABD3R0R6_9STRA